MGSRSLCTNCLRIFHLKVKGVGYCPACKTETLHDVSYDDLPANQGRQDEKDAVG